MVGPGVRRKAADNRPVAFFNLAGGELPAKGAGQFPVQGEEQDAGCPVIQPVGRPDALPDLVAQDLDVEVRFVAVDFGTVDQQPGRLVDDDVLVARQNRQLVSQRSADSLCPECPCR